VYLVFFMAKRSPREGGFTEKLYFQTLQMAGRRSHWIYISGVTESMQSHSTGIRNLNGDAYKNIEIAIPALKEQQRIVAILDEAFAGIATAKANAEKNLQNARELFDSELSSTFLKLAAEAPQQVLGSLCRKITVGHVGSMASRYKESGVVFLRSQNVRPFEIDLKNSVFIDEAFDAELSKSRLAPGDLAIVRTGYPGTAAVIPESLPIANCSDLVIVRPSEQVCPEYLALFFNSEFGKRLVAGKAVGAAQKHFNVTSAKEVMLPLPPRNEQARIVDDCHRLRDEGIRLEHLSRRKLVALDELKRSLLAKAFAGEL